MITGKAVRIIIWFLGYGLSVPHLFHHFFPFHGSPMLVSISW